MSRDWSIHRSRTAEVAQLVEHLVVAQVAEGSSPFFRPRNLPRSPCGVFSFRFPAARASPGAQLAKPAAFAYSYRNGAWRSLVAHLLWEQGVAGSNPVAPTRLSNACCPPASVFFWGKAASSDSHPLVTGILPLFTRRTVSSRFPRALPHSVPPGHAGACARTMASSPSFPRLIAHFFDACRAGTFFTTRLLLCRYPGNMADRQIDACPKAREAEAPK